MYKTCIMQDAIEVSFVTAKHIHDIALKEVEKGTLNWGDLENTQKASTGGWLKKCLIRQPKQ